MRALLIGINTYARAERLRGCVNDVEAMRAYLGERHGLLADDAKILLDGDATLQGIERGLAWLAEGDAGPRFFHYSGHGVQVADDNGDEEDGADEALAPFDFDPDSRTGVLRDDSIARLLAPFGPQTPLVMVVDACHAGTIQKDAARDIVYRYTQIEGEEDRIRVARARRDMVLSAEVDRAIRACEAEGRALSPEEMAKVEGAVMGASARAGLAVSEHVVVLSACRAHERAADANIRGVYRGAFTYYLLKALAQGVTRYDALMERVRGDLEDNEYFQTPELAAAEGMGAGLFWGDAKRLSAC